MIKPSRAELNLTAPAGKGALKKLSPAKADS